MDPSGIISTVAGIGIAGTSGDGGAATEAMIQNILDVAIGPDGSVYFSQVANDVRVRRIDPGGTISTVAGTGTGGFAGDGGPATEASVAPQRIAVGPDGSLYIADGGNNRIRKVDAAGVITTVAGNGVGGFAGDGGPAEDALLSSPRDVAVAPDGGLFIADGSNNRIRYVSSYGVITTIAGDGAAGQEGLDGPARSAQIWLPFGLDLSPSGQLHFTASLQ